MKLKNKLMVAIPACALAVAPVITTVACGPKKQPQTTSHVVPTAEQKTKNVENRNPVSFEFDMSDTPTASDLKVEAINSTDDSIEIVDETISVSEKKLHFVARIKTDYVFKGVKTFAFSVKVTNTNASSSWTETVTGVKINFTPGELQTIALSMTTTTVDWQALSTTALTVQSCFPAECDIKKVEFYYDKTKVNVDSDGYIKSLVTSGTTNITVTATDSRGFTASSTCTVTHTNIVNTLTIAEETGVNSHNIDDKNTTGYQFKVTDQSGRDQTANATWSVTPNTAGSFDSKGIFKPAAGLTETISATVSATIGGAKSNDYEIEIASYDLCDKTALLSSQAKKSSSAVLDGTNLLIPNRIYDESKATWVGIYDIVSNGFSIQNSTIENLYIPSNIAKNGFSTQAFGLTQIKNVKVDPNNASFTSKDQSGTDYNCVMYKKSDSNPDTIFKGTITPTFPNSITTIGTDAFRRVQLTNTAFDFTGVTTIGVQAFCDSNLAEATNTSGIVTIDDSGFSGSAISSFDFGSNLTLINDNAFGACRELTSVDLSKATNLKNIGESAFEDCAGMEELNLSNCTSLESISDLAFAACPKLKKLDVSSFQTVPDWEIGDEAFGVSGVGTVYIYSESLETDWKDKLGSKFDSWNFETKP